MRDVLRQKRPSLRDFLYLWIVIKRLQAMIELKLYEYMCELLKQTPTTFVRYKYDDISWDSRLVGILGPRGIGKSTMIMLIFLFSGFCQRWQFMLSDNSIHQQNHPDNWLTIARQSTACSSEYYNKKPDDLTVLQQFLVILIISVIGNFFSYRPTCNLIS